MCLNSQATKHVFNLIWIRPLEENLRARKDHENYLLTDVKTMRDPEKFNICPKATYWFVILIILYSCYAFCSPQLLYFSKHNWGEPSTDTFPTGKTSTTFNQHIPSGSTVKPSKHFFHHILVWLQDLVLTCVNAILVASHCGHVITLQKVLIN